MNSAAELVTNSPDETMRFAEAFAGVLAPGDFVALEGELGAGKTIFVKGLAKGLGVEEYNYVNSPSFVVVKEYAGKMPLYHFDVYRLDSRYFCETMDYEKYFYSSGVTAVEWAGRITEILPEEYFNISIGYGKGDERMIRPVAYGPRPEKILPAFLEKWS